MPEPVRKPEKEEEEHDTAIPNQDNTLKQNLKKLQGNEKPNLENQVKNVPVNVPSAMQRQISQEQAAKNRAGYEQFKKGQFQHQNKKPTSVHWVDIRPEQQNNGAQPAWAANVQKRSQNPNSSNQNLANHQKPPQNAVNNPNYQQHQVKNSNNNPQQANISKINQISSQMQNSRISPPQASNPVKTTTVTPAKENNAYHYDNESTDSSGSSSTASIDSVVETPENNKNKTSVINESVYAEVDLNKKHLQRNITPNGHHQINGQNGHHNNIPKSIQNPEIAEIAQRSSHNNSPHARQGSNPLDEFETLQPAKTQGLVNLHQHHKYAQNLQNQQNYHQNQPHPNAFRSTDNTQNKIIKLNTF